MAKVKAQPSQNACGSRREPITPEGKEAQMISLAIDCAEQQLRNGSASSQVIVHYLKLATKKAELEKEKLINENKLLQAKTDQLESMKDIKVLYDDAIQAMKRYSGHGDPNDY